MRHLIMHLEAPLMAFGGETIDNLGVIRPFPAVSMLTGLLANALGWRRVDRQRHQDLQDRIVMAARIDREPAGGARLTDFQTAQLAANDRGWTTRGASEGRAGGANTYLAPHLRYRDYYADMRVTVALRLAPADDAPTLDGLAQALQEPARPLFIGRKPCVPSDPLYGGFVEGDTALAALLNWPLPDDADGIRLLWPQGEGMDRIDANRNYMLTDQRNWISGLHGGGRWVCEGSITHDRISQLEGGNDNAQKHL
jgi:CRISPR system Cascade subunit CasD